MAEPLELSLRALYAELKAGQYRSVYVLTGDEPYLIEQAKERLIDQVVNPSASDFDYAEFSDWRDVDAVLNALETPPLLSQKKVVMIKSSALFQNNSADAKLELIDLAALPETACLILCEEKVLKSGQAKKRRTQLEKAGGAILSLSKQSSDVLRTWIGRLLEKRQMKITRYAADLIVDRSERDMKTIADSLERMALYAEHEKHDQIDQALVDLMLPEPLAVRIFDLVDAVAEKRAGRAFTIVDELLAEREPIQLIAFMILRQVRHLLVAADLGGQDAVRETLNVQPFVARKLSSQARKFREHQLLSIHEQGFRYDTDIRRGKIDDKTALYLLVAYACEVS